MKNRVLMIGDNERALLAGLRELANRHPVDMQALIVAIKTPEGKRRHMTQMTAQSVLIPVGYMATFSIELGHGAGTCRHLSVSVDAKDKLPNPHGVWMIAEELGFVGGLEQCKVWIEDLEGHGGAINVVQPVRIMEAANEQRI